MDKKIEHEQYKLDYLENKRKWDRKIEVAAGDSIDRMRELQANEEKFSKQIAELET